MTDSEKKVLFLVYKVCVDDGIMIIFMYVKHYTLVGNT